MLSNNSQRLNIWLTLTNKFDYTEYTEKCASVGCEPQGIFEFSQKAGIISCGILMYPELSAQEAYLKLIEEHQIISMSYTPPVVSVESDNRTGDPIYVTSGCCGGGTVQ